MVLLTVLIWCPLLLAALSPAPGGSGWAEPPCHCTQVSICHGRVPTSALQTWCCFSTRPLPKHTADWSNKGDAACERPTRSNQSCLDPIFQQLLIQEECSMFLDAAEVLVLVPPPCQGPLAALAPAVIITES